tara:strand:- start:470 stop:838 length:369 start_codon:yes stop_codon:yes gene_type:complete
MKKTNETVGNAVPSGSRRGCMCKDGTYSRKCCDGTLRSQGVGRIRAIAPKSNMYRVEFCSDGHKHNVWSDTISLVVGNVYHLTLKNNHHTGCYTVLRTTTEVGLEIESITLYDDCTACIAAN